MVTLSIVRVKQVAFEKEGTYVDKKSGETKRKKSKWIAEISYFESSYSKLVQQNIWRERSGEIDSEVCLEIGDWLVETKTSYEKTIIVKLISKSDLNLLLPPAKQPAKGEKQ
jgi:hypothetical protein